MPRKAANRPSSARKAPAASRGTGRRANTDPQGNSAFAEAAKNLMARWKKEREKGKSGGFSNEIPDIDDGLYTAQVSSASCGVSKQGQGKKAVEVPWFRLSLVIDSDDYSGTQVSTFSRLVNPFVAPDDDRSLEFFSKLIYGLGYDPEEIDLEELPALVKTVCKDKPRCQIRVRNRTDNNGEPRQDIYINKPLD